MKHLFTFALLTFAFLFAGCTTTGDGSGLHLSDETKQLIIDEGTAMGAELATTLGVRNNPEFLPLATAAADVIEDIDNVPDRNALRAAIKAMVPDYVEDPADQAIAYILIDKVGDVSRKILTEDLIGPAYIEARLRLAQAIRNGATNGRLLAESKG